MKTLLVEDDAGLAEALKNLLTNQHYLVEVAADGQTGLELAETFEYDLILLDWMLPKLDGLSFCKRLRAGGNRTPILLMTANDTHTNRVIGLDSGADDYVIKPFDTAELLARIRALLRRGNALSSPVLDWGFLQLDPSSCRVTWRGELVRLTAKEYEMLELFLRNSSRIFSQSALIDRLWSWEENPTENAVRVLIRSLRQKLKQVGAGNVIETLYGLGYRLKAEQPGVETQQVTTHAVIKPQDGGGDAKENRQSQRVSPNAKSEPKTSLDLSAVWRRHKGNYLNYVASLTEAVTALQSGRFDQAQQQKAQQAAHTLKGSLGSFGLITASHDCAQIEQAFQAQTQFSQPHLDALSELIQTLRQSLEQPLFPGSTQTAAPCQNSQLAHLLVVDDDAGLAEQVMAYAGAWGIEVSCAGNPAQARRMIAHCRPDVVLLDLCFPDSAEDGFGLLAEISTVQPPIPVLVFTAQESLDDRVKAVRLGSAGFLHKPIPPTRVLEAVAQVAQKNRQSEANLLIVDDDPQLLDILRTLLEPWGFNLTLLSDPQQFWNTLEQTAPDFLILDVEMPSFNGIDLCQVVRQDPRWSDLPIFFLSAHMDVETRQQVFLAGADEYIHKPIVGPELITRVVNRLERRHVLQRLAETDDLTGLFNQRRATQDLNRLIRLANRQEKPLCLAILDLDNFKQINDQYGHEAGDVVLRRLGELLKRTFRKEDVLARWGGEEFVVALYDTTAERGLERLKSVLDLWRQQRFTDAHNRQFFASFSAGLAEYPQDGNDWQALFRAADVTLYQAKANGRGQVLRSRSLISAG
ncbi:MAG: response regulator [Pseudanabaenales cyanobacterium]|nr:response regulator [Pseudanabaenales cyanobacterium]